MNSVRVVYAWLYALVSPKLGKCSFCMGVAFAGTIAGWAVLVGVTSLWPGFRFVHLLALWPIGFTSLWLLHMAAYGRRRVTKEIHETRPAFATGAKITRRRVATMFVSGIALGVVASAMAATKVMAGQMCCNNPGGICGISGKPCIAHGECIKDGFAGHCMF